MLVERAGPWARDQRVLYDTESAGTGVKFSADKVKVVRGNRIDGGGIEWIRAKQNLCFVGE